MPLSCITILLLAPLSAWAGPVDVGKLLAPARTEEHTRSFDWLAEPRTRVVPLTVGERTDLERLRRIVDDAARRHLGRSLAGERSDLEILQRLVDEKVFDRKQTRSLQALGVVLGDALVREFSYDWVAYEDDKGRSRAVQDPASGKIYFPMTAISRRIETGEAVSVDDVYAALSPSYARDDSTVASHVPAESWVERLR